LENRALRVFVCVCVGVYERAVQAEKLEAIRKEQQRKKDLEHRISLRTGKPLTAAVPKANDAKEETKEESPAEVENKEMLPDVASQKDKTRKLLHQFDKVTFPENREKSSVQ
jgi:hypothetical protein